MSIALLKNVKLCATWIEKEGASVENSFQKAIIITETAIRKTEISAFRKDPPMEIKLLSLQDFKALRVPFPEDRAIHVWILPTEDISNLHKESHRKVKKILSHYTNIPEESLCLEIGRHGKPYLTNVPYGKNFYFNLSHSGKYMTLAISACTPVGIDIENMNRKVNIDRIVKHFFHPLEAKLFSNLKKGEKKEAFFRLWTIKEAFLKGLGEGFAIRPSSFYACEAGINSFHIISSDEKLKDESASWRLTPIPAPDDYICTVAYQKL